MPLLYRDATAADLPAIVAMLADDHLGAGREDATLPLDPAYLAAFHAMAQAPQQRLVVAQDGDRIVGTMHLLAIAGLSARGARHGQIEAVRVAADRRGAGLGEDFVRWAIGELRAAGCTSVQLVSHNSRGDAHRFWRKAGFEQTHAGFKMAL
jgi:ribosomal protein S18 acetylase RimI-like enzyme